MPTRYGPHLAALSNQAVEELTARHRAREQALGVSRQVIRNSANAIRAVHRNDFDEARPPDRRGGGPARRDAEHTHRQPGDLLRRVFVRRRGRNSPRANITLAVISGADIPDAESLDMDPPAYLNGMAEVIGELRRYILDALRRDDTSRCEELMELMDEIYGILVTVDFPEAVTGGLRHSTDAMRGVLERTRGDLTISLQQRRLERRLEGLTLEVVSLHGWTG